jgi:hypothetical protein
MTRERTYRKEIQLRLDEWERIRERARECGMRPAAYIRTVALGALPKARPNQLEKDAIYHLTRVGNNLNQLAHALHRDGPSDLAVMLRQALEEVLAATRRVG